MPSGWHVVLASATQKRRATFEKRLKFFIPWTEVHLAPQWTKLRGRGELRDWSHGERPLGTDHGWAGAGMSRAQRWRDVPCPPTTGEVAAQCSSSISWQTRLVARFTQQFYLE